jgi:hypothetical protein
MSDGITTALTSFWLGTRELNLAELERYYYGTQTTLDNGMLTTEQLSRADVTRFFKPVNYLAAVVDEPVGYLANGNMRITAGENERLEEWAQSYYHRRISPRLDDVVRWQGLYGEAFLYLWTDREGSSRGLKVDAMAPIEGGKKRVVADYGSQDAEELTAAVLYKRVPIDSRGGFAEYRITVTPTRVLVEKRILQHGRSGSGEQWQVESDDVNASGALPVIPIFNPTPSDVLNMIPIQDDLDKLHLDMRLAREFGGYPMLATTGADPGPNLQVGPGRILFGGDFKRIEAAGIEPFLAERDALLEGAAKITKSLTLLTESGNSQSGIALKYRQQAFLERLTGKAQRLDTATALALQTAARILAVDAEMYAAETRRLKAPPSQAELASAEFDCVLAPAIPADELAAAQVAQIWDSIGVSRETVFGKLGIEKPLEEMERVEQEMDRDITPETEEEPADDEAQQ